LDAPWPPSVEELGILVGAWSRSHFLCRAQVTQYLRTLWLEALEADYLNKVISGEVKGDRSQAVEKFYAIQKKHFDYEKLREVFMKDLKVTSSLTGKTRA
jgi:hypothetical protein